MKANTYPIFEADQVLTSGHLNDLVVYLEEQERLTRNKLIGIGIVCGLNLRYSASGKRKEITIGKGCGITSEGYLVAMGETICTHIREDAYVDPVDYPDLKGMRLIEMLTQEEAALEESTDVSPISTISENTLSEMAVVLYLEKLDEDLKNCIPEDCNDKGKKRIFTIRKLLVEKSALRQLISDKQGFRSPQTESTLENAVNGIFHLPEVYIERVVVPQVAGIQLSTLQGVYVNSINSGIPQLALAVGATSELLQPALSGIQDDRITSEKIKAALTKEFENLAKNDPTALQYFYDYLNDLSDAYHEFREEAFDLLSMCCPDESLFGCHLMLGEVIDDGDCEPSIYRHRWYPSPIHDTPNHLTEKVRCLYERLILMLQTFAVPAVDNIEITPSKSTMYALSQRAIPYYYQVNSKTNLYRHWDYDKKRKCKASANLSFHSEKYAEANKQERFIATRQPLSFRLGQNDFFRIEGHLGKNYRTALESIQQQRDQYGLPFDIVALKLGRVPDEPVIDQTCFFQDLDSQFNSLRAEMLCFLTKESNYFADIDYQPKAVRDTGTVGAKKTYEPANTVAVFNYSDYSKSSYKYYNPGSAGNGAVIKKASTGESREGTIGEIVTTQFVGTSQTTYNIQNLLSTFIGRFSNFANLAVGTLILRIQYPLQMISLIEDAVVAIPDNLNELNYEEFEKTYSTLIKKAEEFKSKIEENLDNDDFQKVGNEEDISDHLDRFVFDCNLTRFKALFDEYQLRLKKIMQQSLLSEYAKSHPGLEHTGGVPKGGTFVLIYHDQHFAAPPSTTRPSLSTNVFSANLSRTGVFTKANTPASGLNLLRGSSTGSSKTSGGDVFASRDPGRVASGLSTNLNITNAEIGRNDLLLANQLSFDISRLTNKVVVGDFSLPYICCSDCPPVTYVFPQVAATIGLPKTVFCKPDRDEATYPFILSPEGGEVKGDGAFKDDNGVWVFDPSATNVKPGAITLTYEVEGKSASLTVEVVLAPTAKFDLTDKNVLKSPNGVFLSIPNDSQNADTFLWEVNGQTSTDKDLVRFFVTNPGNELTVKLTATNKACFGVLTQTLSIAADPLVFETESGETSFCADSKEEVKLITKPEGGKVTANTKGFKIDDNKGAFSFNPAVNAVGIHELTYTDKDNRSAKIQILISRPNAEFSVNPTDADGQLVFVELIPIDRTCDEYTWHDGRSELVKLNKLPNPGPKVGLQFGSNEPRKTIELLVDKAKCSNRFTVTVDLKTLLSQLKNRGSGTTGGGTTGGGTITNTLNVGRGNNTVRINSVGRDSKIASGFLIKDLGVDSVAARAALANLPLTITGLSNASLKAMAAAFGGTEIRVAMGTSVGDGPVIGTGKTATGGTGTGKTVSAGTGKTVVGVKTGGTTKTVKGKTTTTRTGRTKK